MTNWTNSRTEPTTYWDTNRDIYNEDYLLAWSDSEDDLLDWGDWALDNIWVIWATTADWDNRDILDTDWNNRGIVTTPTRDNRGIVSQPTWNSRPIV